jgi:hypothetical protein
MEALRQASTKLRVDSQIELSQQVEVADPVVFLTIIIN